MTEKIEEVQEPQTKAIADVLRELSDREESTGSQMLVLGHGTFRAPEDVLVHGLGMKQPDLTTTTVPIAKGEEGMAQIQGWEHHGRVPWVVIVSAEAPSQDSQLTRRARAFWEEGLIQPSTEELAAQDFKYMIPPEWILGAVNTGTGETVLNPQFTGRQVNAEDMTTSEGLRYTAGKLGEVAVHPTRGESIAVPQTPEAQNDGPPVW